MQEGRCRICCGVLFQAVSMDATGYIRLMTEGTEIEWETYGTNYYIRCPHCAAKNIAIRINDPGASQVLDIVAAVMDDE